jgi:hypothetical protein
MKFSELINEELILEAGATPERQERAFIDAVKAAVKKNGGDPITVKAGHVKVSGVTDANKMIGMNELGKEPLTDVILTKGKKQIRLSLKGSTAPSLAGGGEAGIEELAPGILKTAKNKALMVLKRAGKKTGDPSNDFYIKLSAEQIKKLIIGNKKVGGPIDLTYIGSMSVDTTFDPDKALLEFTNGAFYTADKMIAKYAGEFYLRIRKRRIDQKLDLELRGKFGPMIFGKSPSKGDVARVVVFGGTPPKNTNVIN